ncbi:MAG: hypothetical protein AAF617_17285 [Bacteroidota bacterium]
MKLHNDIDVLILKLKRYNINITKEKQRVAIKGEAFDTQQWFIYFVLPLIFGLLVIIGATVFSFPVGLYMLAFVSGFALLGFAYASFFRIAKKQKENSTTKILFNRKLIFKVNKREATYDANNISTIHNSIEVHDDSILTGSVFLIDTKGNKVTIVSLVGYKSNHLRSDLVWLEDFFKKYLQLQA